MALTRIAALGGLGEIGLNCMVVESLGRRVLIDAGLMFPHEPMLGAESIIPDFSYLRTNPVDAVLLTHGHEDHIGALPQLLRQIGSKVPVYGTPFTLELARTRLDEAGLTGASLQPVECNSAIDVGELRIEFVGSAHSIAQPCGLALQTEAGWVVHTGDFKFDSAAPDQQLEAWSALGDRGVALLMSDSTNAERAGHSPGEAEIERSLDRIFSETTGRLFLTMFASHTPRLRSVMRLAARHHRCIVIEGRALTRNVEAARQTGELTVPSTLLRTAPDIDRNSIFNISSMCNRIVTVKCFIFFRYNLNFDMNILFNFFNDSFTIF